MADIADADQWDDWVFPDPATFRTLETQTPLARTRGQQSQLKADLHGGTTPQEVPTGNNETLPSAGALPTTWTPENLPLVLVTRGPNDDNGCHPTRQSGDTATNTGKGSCPSSALASISLSGTFLATSDNLTKFLVWQLCRRNDGEEQKKFREDALLYPKLLVFAVM